MLDIVENCWKCLQITDVGKSPKIAWWEPENGLFFAPKVPKYLTSVVVYPTAAFSKVPPSLGNLEMCEMIWKRYWCSGLCTSGIASENERK